MQRHSFILTALVSFFIVVKSTEAAACQACLFSAVPLVATGRRHQQHGVVGMRQGVASALMPFGMIAARHFATKHGYGRLLLRAQEAEDDEEINDDSEVKEEPIISAAAIGAIGLYKNFISPLLPPACRFVPTCSQYGVQAIKEYGTGKGSILIGWRLLRCSPVGGKGYDPPKWPPVSYTYSSY